MQARDTSTLTDEEVIAVAQSAIDYTKSKMILGSVNRASDEDKPDYYQLVERLEKVRSGRRKLIYKIKFNLTFFPGSLPLTFEQKLQINAKYYEKYQVGNCKEQVTVALAFLKRQKFDDVDICDMLGSDHEFLLLNGRIICDPWDGKVYHARDFAKEREAAKQFRYAKFVYEEVSIVRSYLFGIPRVTRATAKNVMPSIVRGQFVRCGDDYNDVDYSDEVAELQLEYDRLYGKGVKISSLEDFFVADSQSTKVGSTQNVSMECRCL